MMIHNLVKYLVQTWPRLWDIKRTNFKRESCPYDLLEICYFYISQTKSSLDKIFYKILYHHIIYICDFFVNLDDFFLLWFAWIFTKLWFALDMSFFSLDHKSQYPNQVIVNKFYQELTTMPPFPYYNIVKGKEVIWAITPVLLFIQV